MATDQDFSFPTINDSYSLSIDSPPLWNLSPATSPNPYGGLIREGQRKSFSCIEIGRLVRNRDEEEEEDEEKQKMDLLWEDFNEELSSSRVASSSSSREEVELRTVAGRRNSKNASSALILPSKNNGSNKNRNHDNKPGMVVLVKVLKKLFSVSNSQGKPRKRVK